MNVNAIMGGIHLDMMNAGLYLDKEMADELWRVLKHHLSFLEDIETEQVQQAEPVLNITFSGSLRGENLSDLLSEGSRQQTENGLARMFLDPVRADYLKTFIRPDKLAEQLLRDVLMAFGVDVLVKSGSSMCESDLASIVDRYAAAQKGNK